ncbi:MAG: serine acetyltransferase, partial [Chryseobacterium taeanense]
RIGNNVWIGTNAVIVGGIVIEDDVLIAPGAYVNFNVPNNSIVIGNPGKIIPKENPCHNIINNKIE